MIGNRFRENTNRSKNGDRYIAKRLSFTSFEPFMVRIGVYFYIEFIHHYTLEQIYNLKCLQLST